VHAGGWSAKRYDHDVEESWEASARDVAELVARVARDVDARVLIASGDERALSLLPQHLPTELADRFVAVAGGGRASDGSDEVVAAEVVRVLADTLAADTTELLEKYAEERGQNDRATEGLAATVRALQMSQVQTLILTDVRDGGRTLFFGPDATHLAETAQDLLDLGVEQPWEASADEVLLRAALGTGADVKFVAGGVEQAPREGVGALLRYAN
jgi:peptide subunit release factor 1 (eRF1)